MTTATATVDVVDLGIDNSPLVIGESGRSVLEVLVSVLEPQTKTFSMYDLRIEDLLSSADVVVASWEGDDRGSAPLLDGASSDQGGSDEESRDSEHV